MPPRRRRPSSALNRSPGNLPRRRACDGTRKRHGTGLQEWRVSPGNRPSSACSPTLARINRRVGKSHRGGHSSHLTVSTLAQREAQPAGRDRLAESYRRITRPQPVRFRRTLGLRRQGRAVFEHHAPAQRLQCGLVDLTLDLGQVGLGLLVPGIGQTMRQGAVVGQQQQTLTVPIQPPSRVDVLLPNEFGQGCPTVGIGELAQHAVGFVQSEEHGCDLSGSRRRQA